LDPKDTKDRILDAAELLFSEQGIAATSLRSITQRAGVNTAAIHYHFGDKLALVEAIVARRVAPMNQERLKRLDQLEVAAGDGPVDVEQLLRAYLEPVVTARTAWGESARKLGALMARLRLEQTDVEPLFVHFQDLHRRFADALATALPELDPHEAGERLEYAVGAMMQLLMHALPAPGDTVEPVGLEARFERMLHFLSAGFRAPSESTPSSTHHFASAEHAEAVEDRGVRT
jgi:AcrR family transcriptional regulator